MNALLLAVLLVGSLSGGAIPKASPQPVVLLAPGHFRLEVVSQGGVWDYVPSSFGAVSQFERPAEQFGTAGFLAHDYLSGKEFYELERGDALLLVYPDRIELYKVSAVHAYTYVSAEQSWQVYEDIYGHNSLVLQTCYGGTGFWFVVATRSVVRYRTSRR